MNKELELSRALSKKVIDEISNKLNIKELDLNSAIDKTINILENLKRDLPYSAEKRLWNEFNQSVSELHKIKGEINAYYFAKQVSDIMKVDKNKGE
jgi:formylmethanofuran dehydrogenase subunit B